MADEAWSTALSVALQIGGLQMSTARVSVVGSPTRGWRLMSIALAGGEPTEAVHFPMGFPVPPLSQTRGRPNGLRVRLRDSRALEDGDRRRRGTLTSGRGLLVGASGGQRDGGVLDERS